MKEIIQYIKKKSLDNCKIGIVLGSGLDSFCEKLNSPTHIKYSQIPNFRSTNKFIRSKIFNISIFRN